MPNDNSLIQKKFDKMRSMIDDWKDQYVEGYGDQYVEGIEIEDLDGVLNNIQKELEADYVLIKKPTIPNFVAKQIEEHAYRLGEGHLIAVLNSASSGYSDVELMNWINQSDSNQSDFATAILHGFNIAETLYTVSDDHGVPLLYKEYDTIKRWRWNASSDEEYLRLTEDEIRGYDEKFMAFAKEV